MNETTLEKISAELSSRLKGQKFGKIFTLSRFSLAIDFRLHNSEYLFVSVEPSAPRVFLIKRRLRDLEKQSKNPPAFVMFLRKRLANAVLDSIGKLENERILRFAFSARNEIGEAENYTLAAQFTGRSANLFLLDKNDFVLDAFRENFGAGQEISMRYAPPATAAATRKPDTESFSQGDFETLSEALDVFHLSKEVEKNFQAKANAARNKLKQEAQKNKKLFRNLTADLENHGDAGDWKRFGDLLLANLATARRAGEKVSVTDFYDENAPTIEIKVDENDSLTEAAEKFFKKYTKARNAKEEISKRLEDLKTQTANLDALEQRLEEAIEERDESFLAEFLGEKSIEKSAKGKAKPEIEIRGSRRFTSSEGFEILVGKGAKDNDFLTFRAAKSLDLWLHAADYPGSHVVVKNPNRKEIPQKTLLEAAQLAAFYSTAREQTKVAVHYTQKKFVNKPKGSAPGLVSLASFKTILVEPKISDSVEQKIHSQTGN